MRLMNVQYVDEHKGESFLHRIVTCDENWILFDNRKHSVQWLDKDKVPKHSLNIHQEKLIMSIWWSSADIIHYSFVIPDQSNTMDVYCNQLDEMIRELVIKQPRLINRDRSILSQDNARSYVAQTTLLKLQELDLETWKLSVLTHRIHQILHQLTDHFLPGKKYSILNKLRKSPFAIS
ncbi:PREDICTED: histone-lysine N-methyltransferase SETMAR-like [Dinoponera quadriceps]|uniref:Histone-lysine N-methyltransferase SETMAR-like n=1 Tax=Dinoponera quadriceps TaxID=609295 RepID=A0A6P3XY13_DINQU|nr:PREDICTED: histone-lysine N-methyltransferase SETMAR-like [Dinoponera quadriceps]